MLAALEEDDSGRGGAGRRSAIHVRPSLAAQGCWYQPRPLAFLGHGVWAHWSSNQTHLLPGFWLCPPRLTSPFLQKMGDDAKEPIQSVQVFGRKKSATAVAYCKRGKGLIKVNGRPLELVQPEGLQFKLQEPILLLGKDRSVNSQQTKPTNVMNALIHRPV